ncbi:23S rRNA methyltransferase [Paractinoplanes rishiriensis]|uniref:23S rRNA methyltransferase n=1 Tax=Paractinoplanes rishiriensis TaxID=1050105 RepID=A0A919K0E9_9ACTN|nr:23S rRNA methyltransferase [Actinoplanes rishiriensis]
MTETWDVVVVGFGAAGACAAIEAAESGARVLVLDRFTGGGATAISGGIVYAGGGTRQQQVAGVQDTPEAMYAYLREEVGDAVSAGTLRQFCAQSAGMLDWLADRGVPFDARLCPYKTSYPTDRHYLYQSGSEQSFAHVAPPAARGHRTLARGTSGRTFYARLATAARDTGATILPQTRVDALTTDPAGRVTGVECRTLRDAPLWARLGHRVLHRWSVKPGVYLAGLGRTLHRWVSGLESRYARPLRIASRWGVVLTTGGFVFDRDMMREHAPAYRDGLRLGTVGDDGSGIRLGISAGGATRFLDRVTLWRFLSPPSALLGGLLVDRAGRRVCDESRYGAAIGAAILHRAGGNAWLLVDAAILAEARRQVRGQTLWFQRVQARWLLGRGRVSARTVAAVAAKAGVDPDGLATTLAAYNRLSAFAREAGADRAGADRAGADRAGADRAGADRAGADRAGHLGGSGAGMADPSGKPAAFVRAIARSPYSLIDVSVRKRNAVPAPMLTLGGLRVDEETGQVLRADGSGVPGLYSAGRTAAGICSRSYVSGLSLADCVWSGRRAGRHAAVPDRGGLHAHRG